MADREDDEWANHKGGYKSPPPWERFRKGESGNPKGRPKGSGKKSMMTRKHSPALTELETMLSDLLGEEIFLTMGGTKVSATKKKALLLNLFKQAMAGNPAAMRELNRFTERVEAKEQAMALAEAEAEQQAAKEKAERDEALYKYYTDLRKRQTEAWARAAAEELEEPAEPWPHPEDILIDHVVRRGRVRGPLDSDDLKDWEFLRRLRDHCLARMVYHIRRGERIDRTISDMWLVELVRTDLMLPRRWQISRDIMPASVPYLSMTMRELEACVEVGAAVFEAPASGQMTSRELHRMINREWGPVTKLLGFRSYQHMVRYGQTGEL